MDRETDAIAQLISNLPASWQNAMRVRAGLRTLPQFLAAGTKKRISHDGVFESFRASFYSWLSLTKDTPPSSNMLAFFSRQLRKYTPGKPEELPHGDILWAMVFAAKSGSATTSSSYSFATTPLWMVEREIEALDALQGDDATRIDQFSAFPLWAPNPPRPWEADWEYVKMSVQSKDPNFRFWCDWYDARVAGRRSAFDLSGDRKRLEDLALIRKVLSGPFEFDDTSSDGNRRLFQWLEEARERAAKNLIVGNDAEKAPSIPIPSQADAALRFSSDSEGKIVLSESVGSRDLRNDDDARDRHQLALNEAIDLMQTCKGSNSADRLVSMLTSYIKAAGESLETMRPSVFVQKGERLRQESARYDEPDNLLPPLPDSIELDLKSLVKAHNMVVGLDPSLLKMDAAQTGPEDIIGDVTKPEMQSFAHAVRAAKILRDDAGEVLIEAVGLTPDGTDVSDRRFRWSASSCMNLVIEAFSIALKRPGKAAFAASAASLIGPGLIFGNALNTAKFLVERRKWIEEKLGRRAPTWKLLFSDLCDMWDDMLDTPEQ